MTETESVALVETARLEFTAPVMQAMRRAGERDARLGAGQVGPAARRAVAAWVMAVDGDQAALAALAEPEAAHLLMNPVREPWRVAPGPRVTEIKIPGLDVDAEPPRLQVRFRFSGQRRFTDPGQAGGAAGGETDFVGNLGLELADAGPWPWRLTSGHVETLDAFLGYVFTSRRETPEEYRQRAGSAPSPAAAGPGRGFRIRAGFAEHDERFSSSVQVDVDRPAPPDRDEAVTLIWPAIELETTRALGEGDWRPSLNWLDVIELRGEPPAVDIPPGQPGTSGGMSDDHARLSEGLGQALLRPWKLTDATRLGVDAFAERYAVSRGLSYQAAGATPQDVWFLTTVYPKRSHSFMRGPLAGGPDGLLWYAEKVLRGGRGASRQPWTVAYYQIAEATGPASDIACAPRQNPLWGGRVKLASQLPGDLTSVTVGDEPFDQMYEIGITGESDQAGVRALFTPDFTAWMRELPYGKLGVESTRFEVHRGALCVFTRNALATTEDLDAFCQRAVRIAAEVQRVTHPGPPGPPA